MDSELIKLFDETFQRVYEETNKSKDPRLQSNEDIARFVNDE
jgi:hypothetical protein